MLQEVSDKGISCLFIDIYRVFQLIAREFAAKISGEWEKIIKIPFGGGLFLYFCRSLRMKAWNY